MKLHPLLPNGFTGSELASWLRNNAVEKFTDQRKDMFAVESIREFEHESSVNGREMNKLLDLKALVNKIVTKGNDTEEEMVFRIPPTLGTKVLDMQRRQNDDLIERGYELVETEIFGIPNPEFGTMEFFDIEGLHITERTRSLSAKEKHEHLGIFNNDRSRLSIERSGDIADTDTGEVLGKVANG